MPKITPPTLAALATLDIEVEVLRELAHTPLGERALFGVRGGRFEGPRLQGNVLSWGGDSVIRTGGGSRINVRLLLETDDGVPLQLQYEGRASQRDGQPHIEISGSFEAPRGAYAWLNDILVFGLGAQTAGGVRYELFHFSRN
ncbi:DUF3237 domain-containing protein [Solimonas terrae]|uniref:DUF3237 domain-containing protein n=1 Tax=Solimonas terrae TaxID=1396819 RepID=A0A6M2BMU0_9GAMM|nr:DUF3237 domain-containing protein [Solimonas terrae]NGY03972.1 DUF3237 domain-containing protein [Solimonas terrae]